MPISPLGLTYLLFMTVFLPWISFRSARRIRGAPRPPTRRQYLISVVFTQGLFLLLALYVARLQWIALFPKPYFGPLCLILAVAFLVPTLGTLPLRLRWKPESQRWRNLWMFPRNARDLTWWCAVSLLAGVVEEIAFRGVLFTLWSRILGSWWASAVVCSLSFAMAHVIQGWQAVAVIVLFTMAIHGIVAATGDLYTAMGIHFVYDLLAGAIILDQARRAGALERFAAATAQAGTADVGPAPLEPVVLPAEE